MVDAFEDLVRKVEGLAQKLHTAQTAFDDAACRLYEQYVEWAGTKAQRARAQDHLEDAKLIPFRVRGLDGRMTDG